MATKSVRESRSRLLTGSALAFVTVLASSTPALAAHRARLSADLADRLAVGSQAIDVIVHGSPNDVAAIASRYGLQVKRVLRSGAVLRVTAGQLDALAADESIDHLSGDVRIKSSMDEVTSTSIGADQVWAGGGDVPALSGAGVSVAVIDSGIDTKHKALKDRVLATVDFTGSDGSDGYGHGTHVAGIIAGQRGRSSDARVYQGIAPGAYLINLRVLGDDGSGVASDVVEAIDWAIEHARQFNIRIINLSLGTPVLQPFRDDPLCEAVERAARAGILVVTAAGNQGQTADGRTVYGAIASPGNSPYALTVGAIDTHGTPQRSDDTLAHLQLARADAVRPDHQARSGGARQPRRVGGGDGFVSLEDVPRAARVGKRPERLHSVVRDEHVLGGRQRGGCAADSRAKEPACPLRKSDSSIDERFIGRRWSFGSRCRQCQRSRREPASCGFQRCLAFDHHCWRASFCGWRRIR